LADLLPQLANPDRRLGDLLFQSRIHATRIYVAPPVDSSAGLQNPNGRDTNDHEFSQTFNAQYPTPKAEIERRKKEKTQEHSLPRALQTEPQAYD
jgi:hypothetical protein